MNSSPAACRAARQSNPCGVAARLLLLLPVLSLWGREVPLQAQVLELSGGSSSLYQSQGGTIGLRGSAFEGDVSGGVIAGRLVAGARVAYHRKLDTYSAGIEELRFNLPTDLFNSDHRLLGVGVGYQTRRKGTDLQAFAGAASTRFDTPLFQGVRATGASAALLMSHSVSPSVTLTTQVLTSSSMTALQAVQWRTKPWLVLAMAGGIGGTAHYSAVSIDVKRPLVDAKASYVNAGASFHRIGSQPDLTPEPVRENLLFTVRSSRFARMTVTAGRQNFMIPAGTVTVDNGTSTSATNTTDLVSSSNQVSGSTSLKSVEITGSIFNSSFDGESNIALAVSAARQIGPRVHMQSSYFQSRLVHQSAATANQLSGSTSSHSFVTNVEEVLNHRLSANQTISYSNGQASIGYGGSVLSNLLTVSADYQTFYVPTRPGNPFQQTLVLDLQMNFFGRVSVHAGTFVSATGKLLYTADAHAIESRLAGPRQPIERTHFGADILEGRVIDTTGSPVFGAALELGANLLYTDSDGAFQFRDSRPRAYVLKVLLDQFLDGHRYRVVSQPTQVATSNPGSREPLRKVTVVVERDDAAAPVAVASACSPEQGHPLNRRVAIQSPAASGTTSYSTSSQQAPVSAGKTFTFCLVTASLPAPSSQSSSTQWSGSKGGGTFR